MSANSKRNIPVILRNDSIDLSHFGIGGIVFQYEKIVSPTETATNIMTIQNEIPNENEREFIVYFVNRNIQLALQLFGVVFLTI